jgi:hypothetical protein
MTEEPISYVDKRREICDKCEHKKIVIGAKFCEECGCAIWGKTLIKFQSCPKGKWNAEEN